MTEDSFGIYVLRGHDSDGPAVLEIDGTYVITLLDENIATQGESFDDALDMYEDAVNVYASESLSRPQALIVPLGYDRTDLENNNMPDDFSEFESRVVNISGRDILSTLFSHGFYPLKISGQHVKIKGHYNGSTIILTIPYEVKSLNPYICGVIGANFGVPSEPYRFVGWIHEQSS